ncbi:MAG: response regulator transcription factor [Nocardioides sp.]|nr:response regulator transcription factor [Nocardioides sp.]
MSAPTSRSALKILILEDHVLFAESLELVLTIEGYNVARVEVPTNDQSAGSLLTAVLRKQPRIVLLDLDLGPFGDGARLIAPLAAAGINVVVITASADRSRWGGAVRSGARKVHMKCRPLNEILATVRRINQSLPVMDLEERTELLTLWQERRSEVHALQQRIERLTVRERQVLGQLMRGHTVREIATASVVSEATVRTQVKSILAKLEVSSQLAAVGLAHHVGWRYAQSA